MTERYYELLDNNFHKVLAAGTAQDILDVISQSQITFGHKGEYKTANLVERIQHEEPPPIPHEPLVEDWFEGSRVRIRNLIDQQINATLSPSHDRD